MPSPRKIFFGDSRSDSSQFNIDEIETNPFELLVHRIRTQVVMMTQVVMRTQVVMMTQVVMRTQVVLDEIEVYADVWRS